MSKILSKGLTVDDVLLVPAYSEVTPDVVDVTAWLTPSISLNIPLVSAAMDTVTESAMAISMARAGGIGIVHKKMCIRDSSHALPARFIWAILFHASFPVPNPSSCKESPGRSGRASCPGLTPASKSLRRWRGSGARCV